MYIFEFIAKKIRERKESKQASYGIEQADVESAEKCEHTFFPIDSTGEMLACSKCGFMVANDSLKIKSKNPFN